MRDAAPRLIAQTKITLGRRAFLFRRSQIPFNGFFEILWDNLPLLVKNTQVKLRSRVTAPG